jgi:hypothetical protein
MWARARRIPSGRTGRIEPERPTGVHFSAGGSRRAREGQEKERTGPSWRAPPASPGEPQTAEITQADRRHRGQLRLCARSFLKTQAGGQPQGGKFQPAEVSHCQSRGTVAVAARHARFARARQKHDATVAAGVRARARGRGAPSLRRGEPYWTAPSSSAAGLRDREKSRKIDLSLIKFLFCNVGVR